MKKSRLILLVVVLSVALSVVWPWLGKRGLLLLGGGRQDGRLATTTANLHLAAMACTTYYNTFSTWPTSLDSLGSSAGGPYVEWPSGKPEDGWGHALRYTAPSSPDGPVVIVSLGADGVAGGSGADADLEITFDRTYFKQPAVKPLGGLVTPLPDASATD